MNQTSSNQDEQELWVRRQRTNRIQYNSWFLHGQIMCAGISKLWVWKLWEQNFTNSGCRGSKVISRERDNSIMSESLINYRWSWLQSRIMMVYCWFSNMNGRMVAKNDDWVHQRTLENHFLDGRIGLINEESGLLDRMFARYFEHVWAILNAEHSLEQVKMIMNGLPVFY